MALMTPTSIPMVNRGNTTTVSNTVAATTMVISVNNTGTGVTNSNTVGGNVLMVAAIAIFTASVTVSSISTSASQFVGWTFQGATSEPGSGIRIELWTTPITSGNGANNSTITFSSAALASCAVTNYTQPYDYASSPLVNNGIYFNTSGVNTGVHVETISPAAFTSGNLIILSVQQSGTITGITDSVGTTYTLVNTANEGAFGANIHVYVYAGLAGGTSATPTVTISYSATSGVFNGNYYLSQWAGVTATVDTSTSAGVPSLGGAVMNTLNLATTFANDLIHAVLGTFSAPTVLSQAPGYCITGSWEGGRVVTSTGTYPTYFTNNNSSACAVTAFKISPTYTPTAAPIPNIVTAHSASGTGFFAEVDNTPQFGGGMIVTVYAVATTSGDTFAGSVGTLRSSVTPTVTSAAAVIMENGTESTIAQMRTQLRMSAQRAWAAISFELVAGNATYTLNANPQIKSSSMGQAETDKRQIKSNAIAESYKVDKFVQGGSAASLYLSAANLAGGTPGIAYTETISANGGFSPYVYTIITGAVPTGTTLNSSTGVISGTPTTIGTYNFTVKAVDSAANTATNSFQIIIAASGSGGSFTFVS